MSSNLVQMPAQRRPVHELEARLLGAALHLRAKLGGFEGMGLGPDDFTDPRVRLAWSVAKRLAERRGEVTAATVHAFAGPRLMTDADLVWLEQLELSNTLNEVQLLQAAEHYRRSVRGRVLADRLEQEAKRIRNGEFVPAQVAGTLEGLVDQLVRDTSPDEDCSSDVAELLERWEKNEKTGKSMLLPTGLTALDDVIGGLPPTLALVAAGPGVGKSTLLASMMHAQLTADPNLRIGFFGLEDGTEWVLRRWMARYSGMPLREVGWKLRTEEQRQKTEAAAEAFFPLLQRITSYRHDTIDTDQLLVRANAWATKGVGAIYVDNLSEVEHRSGGQRSEHFERVAETTRRMRNLANRWKIPVVFLVHTTEETKGPAGTAGVRGGKASGQKTRLLLDLWEKNGALRCTVSKNTEGPKNVTIEFSREFSAGLVKADEGGLVNLQAEARAEREAREESKLEISEERRKRREAKRAREKALEHDKAEAPQPTLFDGGGNADAE